MQLEKIYICIWFYALYKCHGVYFFNADRDLFLFPEYFSYTYGKYGSLHVKSMQQQNLVGVLIHSKWH